MFGEWSVAFDTLVVLKLYNLTDAIAKTGVAPELHRQLPPGRQDFLQNFAKAQMITYEAAELGISVGWFYWTFKMEGGVFAEWDFLRGIREGWLPKFPPRNVSSEEAFDSTCHDIIFQTNDDMSIVHEYPAPDNLPPNSWMGDPIDDDVVVTHGESLLNGNHHNGPGLDFRSAGHGKLYAFTALAFFGYAIYYTFFKGRKERKGYTQLSNAQISV